MRIDIIGDIKIEKIRDGSGFFHGTNVQMGRLSNQTVTEAANASQGEHNQFEGFRSAVLSGNLRRKKRHYE